MTALGRRDVERFLRTTCGDLTGLPRRKSHEARGQNLSNLVQVRGRISQLPDGGGHCQKLNEKIKMSSGCNRIA